MFGYFLKKRVKSFEEHTKNSFDSVKKDIEHVGNWLKHLDGKDKQLFELHEFIKKELSTIRSEVQELKERIDLDSQVAEDQQVFKKLPVLDKQTDVLDIQEVVQTAVQTGNLYDILKSMSANERLLVLTLANNDMKLSYEDLAMLLGKERSTIRGQINSIKQKSEGLIQEVVEKSGKKRVFVPENVREKLAKYAKVRGKKR